MEEEAVGWIWWVMAAVFAGLGLMILPGMVRETAIGILIDQFEIMLNMIQNALPTVTNSPWKEVQENIYTIGPQYFDMIRFVVGFSGVIGVRGLLRVRKKH